MTHANSTKLEKLRDWRTTSLSTPSDLDARTAKEVGGAMNEILADVFALYLKTKNFHWHMTGPHFRDYHLLLDEQSDQIFAMTDPIAERVRKIGAPTSSPSVKSPSCSTSWTTRRTTSSRRTCSRSCARTTRR